MWAKIMVDWLGEDKNRERFTFHDLRAYYVTHMIEGKKDPETHSNPARPAITPRPPAPLPRHALAISKQGGRRMLVAN